MSARPSDRCALPPADVQPLDDFGSTLGAVLGLAAGVGAIIVWRTTSSPMGTALVPVLLAIVVTAVAITRPSPIDVVITAGGCAVVGSVGLVSYSWLENRPPGDGSLHSPVHGPLLVLLVVVAAVAGVLAVWWVLDCPRHFRGPYGPSPGLRRLVFAVTAASMLGWVWAVACGAMAPRYMTAAKSWPDMVGGLLG